jgi:predicted dehydrogenase
MINLVQIGVGYWGGNLLRTFSSVKGARMRYVCDLNPGKQPSLEALHPNAVFCNDFLPLVNAADVDAAVIATPAPTHFEIAKAFLEAGKHCFIEKPFVLRVDHAEELVDIAEKKGLVLMVGHLLLYHPAYVELKARMQKPEFGEIRYLNSSRANLGIVRSNENVMWSFAPHDIALSLFLLEEKPTVVNATGQSFMQSGIEDVCFLTLGFPSGRLVHIHVSWMYPRKLRLLTAVGSKQMIEVDDAQINDKMAIYNIDALNHGPEVLAAGYSDRYLYESITFKRGDTVLPRVSGAEPLKLECQHFIDCIEERREPLSSGKASLEVVRILAEADLQLKNSRRS